MISVSNLAKSFGDRTLFAGASFRLNPGERYGLVGANGSGKTTLLNILSRETEASAGTVVIPKRLRMGVFRQDQFRYDDHEIVEVALMGNRELWDAMREKEALLAKGERHFDADRFSELEEIVQLHDGYTAESRAAAILEGLGLPAGIHRAPLSTHERMVAFLIEHFGGAFPTWLAPVQVRVITVSEQFEEYGRCLVDRLRARYVRAEMAASGDTVSKKIRDGTTRKIPNLLIVGEREQADGTVTLRRYGVRRQETVPFEAFEAWIHEQIASRALSGE